MSAISVHHLRIHEVNYFTPSKCIFVSKKASPHCQSSTKIGVFGLLAAPTRGTRVVDDDLHRGLACRV